MSEHSSSVAFNRPGEEAKIKQKSALSLLTLKKDAAVDRSGLQLDRDGMALGLMQQLYGYSDRHGGCVV